MPEKKKSTSTEHSSHPSAFEVSDTPKAKASSNREQKKQILIICIILTAIIIVGIGVYYYLQYQHEQALLKNPLIASQMIQETVVTDVGKLTQLPTDQKPAIAKVTDITKLKNQPFFQNAKNGDFVLLYSKDRRVILYDPVANKIIESAILPASALATPTPMQSLSIAIYNGTTIAGLAKKTQTFLQQKMNNIDIVSEANAANQGYKQTLVIDLTGNNPVICSQLASLLGAAVAVLPKGEVKPANTDVLIILGSRSQ
jgi:uncharacterized protein YneF (UPF0154 family)